MLGGLGQSKYNLLYLMLLISQNKRKINAFGSSFVLCLGHAYLHSYISSVIIFLFLESGKFLACAMQHLLLNSAFIGISKTNFFSTGYHFDLAKFLPFPTNLRNLNAKIARYINSRGPRVTMHMSMKSLRKEVDMPANLGQKERRVMLSVFKTSQTSQIAE